MLNEACHSPILLRDCFARAVKKEDFYLSLITAVIPINPDALHTRLYQCIRQSGSKSSTSFSVPGKVYHMNDNMDDSDAEYKLCYTDNGAPIFKSRILRGFYSFSNLENREKYMDRVCRCFYRGTRGVRFIDCYPLRPLHARPKKNPVDATGRVMLCNWYNYWFHLVKDCPDRVQSNSNYSNTDDNSGPVADEYHNGNSDNAFSMEISIGEYPQDQAVYNAEPTKQNLSFSLPKN